MNNVDWNFTWDVVRFLIGIGIFGLIGRIWIIARQVRKNIMFVCSEMLPNHGSTLRDCLDRVDAKITGLQEDIEALKVKIRIVLDQDTDRAIFLCDMAGECIWVNKTYLKMINKDMESLLGNNWQNIIHVDDREKVVSEWNRSVNSKRNFEMVYNYIDDSNNKILAKCSAIFSPKFGYIGFVSKLEVKPTNLVASN